MVGAVMVSGALGNLRIELRFRIVKPIYVIAGCTKIFPSADNKPDYNRHEEE